MQAVHIRRRRFPHPYCSVRVGGRDYDVPIPNWSGWCPNAPPRKGVNWFPSPRMKGETAELSKLMQNKREEKTTPRKEVLTKKERGKRLNRKEKAEVSTQNVVAAVQVQVATKPEDNLFEAMAETDKVIAAMVNTKPGVNLFREVKKRGRPPKELLQQQEAQVLQKLYRLTPTDKKFMLASLDAMLDSVLSSKREGEKEKKETKEKVPTKKAIEKAAAKAAEDATTKAVFCWSC